MFSTEFTFFELPPSNIGFLRYLVCMAEMVMQSERELIKMPSKNSLRSRHESLDNLIDLEMKRPCPDTLKVSGLKKEKLYIKERLYQS